MLGIEAGEYDVQRLVYHHFMKCFWSEELDAEANAAVNFDWYHPQLSSRHTIDQCRKWFADAGLEVEHEHEDPTGSRCAASVGPPASVSGRGRPSVRHIA